MLFFFLCLFPLQLPIPKCVCVGGGRLHVPQERTEKNPRLSRYIYFVFDPFKFQYLCTFYNFTGYMTKSLESTEF